MEFPSNLRRLVYLVGALVLLIFVWIYQTKALGIDIWKGTSKEVPVAKEEDRSHLLEWTLATSSAPWSPRDSHAAFLFQDKIWIAGGITGNGLAKGTYVPYWEFPHFNDVWNSADGVTWEKVADHVAWPTRRSMSIIEYNGRLWMFGGWSPIGSYKSDIWVSDNGVDWKKVVEKAPWAAREGQIALIFKGKLFMIGGVNYDLRKTYNDVWSTTDGVTWTEEVASAPWGSRWDHAVAELHGKLFLVGGMKIGGATFKDVWSSSDGATWELVTDAPPWISRQGLQLLRYRGKLWMVGRLNDEFDGFGPNDIWYSEDGTTWEKTDVDPAWLGREDHAGYVFKDVMWIAGGMDSNEHWNNDVWYAKIP